MTYDVKFSGTRRRADWGWGGESEGETAVRAAGGTSALSPEVPAELGVAPSSPCVDGEGVCGEHWGSFPSACIVEVAAQKARAPLGLLVRRVWGCRQSRPACRSSSGLGTRMDSLPTGMAHRECSERREADSEMDVGEIKSFNYFILF